MQTYSDYSENFIDYANHDFHLKQTSQLIDAGDNTVAPDIDLDGNVRPSGTLPDIGAYEYQFPTTVNNKSEKLKIKISPNPFVDYIYIKGESISDITLFDINGKKIKFYFRMKLPGKIDLSFLNSGIYIIKVRSIENSKEFTKYMIKSY